MKRVKLMDLYTDFLTTSPQVSSALVFVKVLLDSYSHDSVTRMLAQAELDQQTYWRSIKKLVRRVESDVGVLSIDDFIIHKPHSRENELVSYHYDHTSGQSKRGINVVSFTYVTGEGESKTKLPIAFELVRKDSEVTKMVKDKRTGKFVEKTSRKASVSKNELLRNRLKVLTHQNQVRYGTVTFDTWYSSAENMTFIVKDLQKHFVCAIKDNRRIVLLDTVEEGNTKKFKQKDWVSVSKADIEPNRPYLIKLKNVPFVLVLVKKVFHNSNGTVGVQYIVGSDTRLQTEDISAIYKNRWSSEDVHRSLKQNAAIEKMPAKLERSQANYIFAAMMAQVKLEALKIATKTNHYTLKRNILIEALKTAWEELKKLKELCIEKSIEIPNFSGA